MFGQIPQMPKKLYVEPQAIMVTLLALGKMPQQFRLLNVPWEF
jgi:hypothetical protein